MPKSLPSKPSIKRLQKQAKDLLRGHKRGNAGVCEAFRLTHRFAESTDQEILQTSVSLQETQYALALDYGFKGWKQLKAHVESMQEVEAEAPGIAGPATILLVDDEDVIRDVGRAMLTRLHYDVLVARNGEEAIQIARSSDKQIDFVLLDTQFREGAEVYRHLINAQPATKIIVCSGYSIGSGPVQELLDAGANGFLQKPYNLGNLSAKLNEVLAAENPRDRRKEAAAAYPSDHGISTS